VSSTVLGALLLGGTLSYAVFLRYLPVPGAGAEEPRLVGAALVAFPLLLTWTSDSGAYFGGRAFGRRKLMPSVSPGKTVAGAVAGVFCSVAAGALLGWLLFGRLAPGLGIVEAAIGGALISVVAQVGDLAESLLKREAKVKDSGTLFPGHGGLLDRVDSLLFAIPVAFWYLGAVL
jgi:phosphatidate cytidylyltransferase